MLEALHRDGFTLIPGVLTSEQVAELRAAIDGLTRQHWDITGPIDRYLCVFNRDPFWLRYLDVAGIIDLAEAALGRDCHIIGQTAWRSHPGSRGPWGGHCDYVAVELPERWLRESSFKLPMHVCTAHYYLSDITEDLCPTKVIPGSHRSGRHPHLGGAERKWQGRGLEPVLCNAGDVLFYRSDLWHSGSENTTADRVRYLLQVHYGRRDVAQRQGVPVGEGAVGFSRHCS